MTYSYDAMSDDNFMSYLSAYYITDRLFARFRENPINPDFYINHANRAVAAEIIFA